MSAYLLTCECGNSLPVEIGQAGGQVTCVCGKQVEVPTLRQLRHLPQVRATASAPEASPWGARQGIIAASLIAMAVLIGWSGWTWYHDPEIAKFNPEARFRVVDEQLKTPVGAWKAWVDFYKPMAEQGLQIFQPSNVEAIEQYLAGRRFMRGMLLAVAGCFALLALAAKFWPPAQPVGPKGRKKKS